MDLNTTRATIGTHGIVYCDSIHLLCPRQCNRESIFIQSVLSQTLNFETKGGLEEYFEYLCTLLTCARPIHTFDGQLATPGRSLADDPTIFRTVRAARAPSSDNKIPQRENWLRAGITYKFVIVFYVLCVWG